MLTQTYVSHIIRGLKNADRHIYIYASSKTSLNFPVTEQCGKLLDELRDIRSELDGTAVKFVRTEADLTVLQDHIRPVILMQVPRSLTPEVKDKLTELVQTAFKG